MAFDSQPSIMISSIKLFYLNDAAMIALYGGDQIGDDHWLSNLPAEDVVEGDPSPLPVEEALPIERARRLVRFTPSFKKQLKPINQAMKSTELVAAVSEATGIPIAQVRKITAAVLSQLAVLIESGQPLSTPKLIMRPRSRKVESGKDLGKMRKTAIMLPRRPKDQRDDIAASGG